ncbi:MAG: NADH-quinone oxidoreductase subunit I [Dehalococcoidia bacterium]|nr:NADH-quinone oxidoreductase subunit I [Dehalococcoidia bacterium]MSQ16612.1 NADH-quinone oxidoreductase subunit I [Dehalococcoidia bacterium]
MYGLQMVRGLLVTLKNLRRKPFTVQYPEERLPQHPRFRGEEFVWYEERCTGCASCAKYCPLGIIKIVTSPSGAALPQGEKYKLEVFDIDISRCMFCGLCVEACPYDALFMGSGFEQSRYSRLGLVIPVKQLREAEKRPSTWFRPQLEGTAYNPHQGQPLDWKQVGRESWRWHQREKAGMRLAPDSEGDEKSPQPPFAKGGLDGSSTGGAP